MTLWSLRPVLAAAVVFLAASLPVLAADTAEPTPVDIRSTYVEMKYRGTERWALFTGGVTVLHGSSKLTSDQLETMGGANDEAIARGNVVFQDFEKKLDLMCDELQYTDGLEQMFAKGNCQLISGEGMDVTVVTSDEMEVYVSSREAVAIGAVRIMQGENEAVGKRAHLFGDEDRVVLTGRPILRRPPHEFECDQAVTYFKEGRTILTGAVRGTLHTEQLDELSPENLAPSP